MRAKLNTPRVLVLAFALAAALAALAPASALASKQVVDFFGGKGTEGGQFSTVTGLSVAVNNSGAGGVPVGTIYALDSGGFDEPATRGNRVERFERDYDGTPGEPADDTYQFVSAWGAGVENGGTNYEVCTVAAKCRDGAGIGGNGTLAGDGSLSKPGGIAVDQDTGEVYVADSSSRRTLDDNFRINVYSATGAFLRSFGWDVVESGPDDNGTGYEVCKAGIDVCKAGLPGSGAGQIGLGKSNGEGAAEGIAVSQPDGNAATGTVFLADRANHRIDTYNLDGSSPGSIGSASTFSGESAPERIAVDSRGIVYANNGSSEIERYDSQNADGGGVGFLAPIVSPPLSGLITALAVDPGPGPDTDALYVGLGNPTGIQQYGPVNSPGLLAPPSAPEDTHATDPTFSGATTGIAVDQTTGQIYASAGSLSSGFAALGVYVLGAANPTPPTATLDSLSDETAHSITVHATVNPNGAPDSSYYLEYSTDGTTWQSTPAVVVGHQSSDQAVEAVLEPGPFGLLPNTTYHVRLEVQRRFAEPILATPSELSATTLPEAPSVQAVGSPIRTATTARLDSRLDPNGSSTAYRFEYGDQGPCESSPCESSEAQSAGAGQEIELVSQEVENLQPNTTYHYRLIAENGAPGSPVYGEDMTVTTRASDAPLTHGHFPGPPGSDRAWEQVNTPNTSGNPINAGWAFSDDGDRAIYAVTGGLTQGVTGNLLTPFFAERTSQGWQTRNIYPARSEIFGEGWTQIAGSDDLSSLVDMNTDGTYSGSGPHALFSLDADASPTLLREKGGFAIVSDDGSRVAAVLSGAPDPAYPGATGSYYYDISSGSPHLLSLLPGNAVPSCGVPALPEFFEASSEGATGNYFPLRAYRWLSPDGSLFFFASQGNNCSGPYQIYLREIEAEETVRISPPAISGPECSAAFVKSTPGSVFFWTQSRLVSEDTAISGSCVTNPTALGPSTPGGDVYRYDLSTQDVECVTCVAPQGLSADVQVKGKQGPLSSIVVAADGSRVYFTSPNRLLPGAAQEGIYRVDVASGELAYVAPGTDGMIGEDPYGGNSAATASGTVIAFQSSEEALNSLTGSDNGGTLQDYLYDDRDRSLVCASCTQDGSAPTGAVPAKFTSQTAQAPNITPLSEDGDFAFVTPTPLVTADQNTAAPGQKPEVGADVYEWRDGRQLLVSDGLISSPESSQAPPQVQGIDPSGQDIFFTQAAQLTPDALDGIRRLYDARIGGGFEFPAEPQPCPLDACQGTPKGAPQEATPGTSSFQGEGNAKSEAEAKPRCPKGKREVRRSGKSRCVAKKQRKRHRPKHAQRRADHHRRAHR